MFRNIAFLATLLTWPLISFGAIVRLYDAGLSCPDWPLCYGQIVPTGTADPFRVWLEQGHRFVATFVGLLLTIMLLLSIFNSKYKSFKRLSWICFILVSVQGILGGLTVIMKLWPPIVTFHLIGGNLLLTVLIYISYRAFREEKDHSSKQKKGRARGIKKQQKMGTRLSFLSLGMLFLAFLILTSGGANSTTYSGVACYAFPGCHLESFSSFYWEGGDPVGGLHYTFTSAEDAIRFTPRIFQEWVHMIHRTIAVTGGTVLLIFAFWVLFREEKRLHKTMGILLFLSIFAEILVGILNAVYRLPIPISFLHTFLASCIVGTLSFSFAKANYETPLKR